VDNELLRLIARLKIAAARSSTTIDVVRFVADKTSYARAMLGRFTDGADEDGILLALQILDRMGLSSTAASGDRVVALAAAKPPVAEASAEALEPAAPKYVGSLRG
jgi:hypothetical protein